MSKSERVNLRLTPEMKEQLQRAADKEHRTLTNFIESLVIRESEKMRHECATNDEHKSG